MFIYAHILVENPIVTPWTQGYIITAICCVSQSSNGVLEAQIHMQCCVLESKPSSNVCPLHSLAQSILGIVINLINHDNLVAVKQYILTGIKIIFNVFLNQNFLKIFGMYCYFPLSCKHTLKGEKLCSREYFSASWPPAYR